RPVLRRALALVDDVLARARERARALLALRGPAEERRLRGRGRGLVRGVAGVVVLPDGGQRPGASRRLRVVVGARASCGGAVVRTGRTARSGDDPDDPGRVLARRGARAAARAPDRAEDDGRVRATRPAVHR